MTGQHTAGKTIRLRIAATTGTTGLHINAHVTRVQALPDGRYRYRAEILPATVEWVDF
jgi:hypothetical protein